MGAPARHLGGAHVQRPRRACRRGGAGFLGAELARAENGYILRQIRAAVQRGLRPTTLTHRRRNPYGKWSELDHILLEAFQSYEDETSKSSGHPVWLTRLDDGSIDFQVEEGIDLADAAIAQHDKAREGKKEVPGSYRYAVPITFDGSPVPEGGLAREAALRARASEARSERPVLPGSDIVIERRKPKGGYNAADYG